MEFNVMTGRTTSTNPITQYGFNASKTEVVLFTCNHPDNLCVLHHPAIEYILI